MDVCLQLHGEKIIYPIPSGLHELMWDISKEVLHKQPSDIYFFIYKYLNSMLKLREATKNAVVVVDDIVNESSEIVKHINNLGTTLNIANSAATKIQNCFKSFVLRNLLKRERENGDEMSKSILEYLKTYQLDYDEVVKACKIIQRSYRRHKASKVSLAISDADIKNICDPNKLVNEESPKGSLLSSGSKALDKEEAGLEETQYGMNSLKHYSTEKLEGKLFDFTEMKPGLLQNINSENNLIHPTIPEEFIEIDFTQKLESPNSIDVFSQKEEMI
uniref:RIIa domain-containing protein n=1 Tax=Clastoptera arizonana TaxID=38151 RepID=A0A1B6CGU4_9HEMI